MKPEDIKNKKIAVLCDTLEKAKKFCEICGDNDSCDNRVRIYKEKLCQNYENDSVCCADIQYYESDGFKVITFEEFIGEYEKEAPLTAEEVVEVLLGDGKAEIFAERFTELFGGGHCISEIGGIFTPSEIVQKVTEWKRKQDKLIRVTEDMIADVLDEKYGIGNWGREE